MFDMRSLRPIFLIPVVSAALVLGTTGAGQAAPLKLGPVTGLAATVSKPGASYAVATVWNALAGATGYQASITRSGATLASGTVASPGWTGTITAAPGAATLTVTPLAGKRHGTAASITVNLPDLTAPSGTYTTSWTGSTATLTQVALTDDSPVSQVKRVVSWGDGTAAQTWAGTGTTLTHQFAATGRYLPTVTLSDAAGNAVTISTPAIVIGDKTPPSGSFGVTPSTAWAGLTSVQVTQVSLSDDYSPSAFIARVIDWGDGSAPATWAPGAALTHVYAVAGSYTPVVTITDEAGNAAQVSAAKVTVAADATAPTMRLLLPTTKVHSVRSWAVLRGLARDVGGTGVATVAVRVVEKRGSSWFGYRPATSSWVKAATRAKAFRRGTPFGLTTNAQHRWSAKLAGLRQGTLVYHVVATDRAGNRTPTMSHQVTLTQP